MIAHVMNHVDAADGCSNWNERPIRIGMNKHINYCHHTCYKRNRGRHHSPILYKFWQTRSCKKLCHSYLNGLSYKFRLASLPTPSISNEAFERQKEEAVFHNSPPT